MVPKQMKMLQPLNEWPNKYYSTICSLIFSEIIMIKFLISKQNRH